MNKAEQRALEAYPRTNQVQYYHREGFVLGYEQAEKDLALTWKDLRRVAEVEQSISEELGYDAAKILYEYPTAEAYYTEVLKRFKEEKK